MEKIKTNKILIAGFLGLLLAFAQSVFAIPATYQRCAPSVTGTDCTIGEYIYADDRSTPITTDDYCQITITDPADSVVVNGVNMLDKNDGWYYYSYSPTPATEGLYRTTVCCDTLTNKKCIDKTFIVGTSFESLPAKVWASTTRTLSSFGTLVADISTAVWGATDRTLTSFGTLAADVWTSTTRTLTAKTLTSGNLATESYIDTAVATIRGGDTDLITLAGYVDSIEGYIGTPAVGSPATLFLAAEGIRAKVDTIDTNLTAVDGIIDLIRASQLLDHTLKLSDTKEIEETKDYRAKLTILDYESNPTDASSTPTVILYDALRATIVNGAEMTKLSTGVYEYVYTTLTGAANGAWETLVSVDLGGSTPVKINDYWEVTGSPAQVIINSITDTTVPSISANVTISNEGSVGYEYQYEYCVVSTETNQCGGGDDVDYATAAKYIAAGQDWTTDLGLTVPNIGVYWFKVVVYWGTETSGASRTFTATEAGVSVVSGGGGGDYCSSCIDKIYSKLLEVQKELGYHEKPTSDIGASAYDTLKMLGASLKNIGGTKGYNLDSLYDVSNADLTYLKNKSLEIKALLGVNKILIDKVANEPVVTTWFEWNSVVLKMLVVNPSSSQTQVISFKTYLPRETKPEYIIDKGDLLLDFDEQTGLWYVHKEIKLKTGEFVTQEVEIKDIWVIPQEEINSLKKQFEDLIKPLEGTSFFAQAVTLKSDGDRLLDGIARKQNEYQATPQEHIVIYRENLESLKAVNTNLEALKQLVTDKSNAGGALGQLFGVSTTMTWAIIIIVVIGIAILMVLLYIILVKRRVLDIDKNITTENSSHPAPENCPPTSPIPISPPPPRPSPLPQQSSISPTPPINRSSPPSPPVLPSDQIKTK